MKNVVIRILSILAVLLMYGLVFLSLFLDFAIIIHSTGFVGALIAFLILPVTFVVTPFYSLIRYGSWVLVIIVYGGAAIVFSLFYLANILEKKIEILKNIILNKIEKSSIL